MDTNENLNNENNDFEKKESEGENVEQNSNCEENNNENISNNDVEEDENTNKVLDEENIEKDNDDTKEEKSEIEIQIEKTKLAEDKYVRLFAEFQNFRNRSEKEKADMYDIGVSSAILKFLPVVDNIERAIENIPEDLKNNAFVDGVDKVYKQLLKTFDELDIKPIEAKGKMFDPNLHNAVMTDEESDAEVDTITDVMLKGYTYKDQVIRHSMVKVKK